MNETIPGEVAGFEFSLCDEDGWPPSPPVGTSVTYVFPSGDWTVIDSGPCFLAATYEDFLPPSPCVTLVKVHLTITSPEPWCFGVGPNYCNPSSFPAEMGFVGSANLGDVWPMYACVGPNSNSCYMACINTSECPPPVAVDEETWGHVKALYQ
jgi:hypothetical protein